MELSGSRREPGEICPAPTTPNTLRYIYTETSPLISLAWGSRVIATGMGGRCDKSGDASMKCVWILIVTTMICLSITEVCLPSSTNPSANAAPMTITVQLEIEPSYTVEYWNNRTQIRVDGIVEYENVIEGDVELYSHVYGMQSAPSPRFQRIQGSGSYPIHVSMRVHDGIENCTVTITINGTFWYDVMGETYYREVDQFQGDISIVMLEKPWIDLNETTEDTASGVVFDISDYTDYIWGAFFAVLILVLVYVVTFEKRKNEAKARKYQEWLDRNRNGEP
jgi:hypothetical protein